MNRHRREFGPPPVPVDPPLLQQQAAAASKPNRLRRSFRRTQSAEQSGQPEFKTPTRIPRCKAAGCFSGESPHNESDLQDIVWDATSPSPHRLGKRGNKQPPGVVDISEIVSRIAPKHGRPAVSEPTLQQWIGDSANIPCTPEVQISKARKKSPRPNGVDGLLKLAKQFDFSMFHQEEEEEEEEEEELQQHHLDFLSAAILDFDPPPSEAHRPSDPDLDFLFDQPTQRAPFTGEDSGKNAQLSLFPAVSQEPEGGAGGNGAFEDDWESDDLLNDSVVLEMTQLCPAGGKTEDGRQKTSLNAAQKDQRTPFSSHKGFSGGPGSLWDDPLDDELLWELCEDLEKQMQTSRAPPAGQPAVSFKHPFTFRAPSQPVSMATSTAVVKCSAAEIELKKQQAMERRRQRIQAAQNLQTPT